MGGRAGRVAGVPEEGSTTTRKRWEIIPEFLQGHGEPGSGAGDDGRGLAGAGRAVVQHERRDSTPPSIHLGPAGLRVKCCSDSLCSRNQWERQPG